MDERQETQMTEQQANEINRNLGLALIDIYHYSTSLLQLLHKKGVNDDVLYVFDDLKALDTAVSDFFAANEVPEPESVLLGTATDPANVSVGLCIAAGELFRAYAASVVHEAGGDVDGNAISVVQAMLGFLMALNEMHFVLGVPRDGARTVTKPSVH